MNDQKAALGMIGLGVMGRNLLLNIADHGFPVVGYDRNQGKVDALREEGESTPVRTANTVEEMLNTLARPRLVMLLVPAGAPVDAVIEEIAPHLAEGDTLIDGGNSHFTDTDRRQKALAEKGLAFLGVGVSGGEYGARHGPSIMPGGDREAYERIAPMLEAAAARMEGEPCVTWLGPGSAGHFVKMVHNGIEYGLMELIAEAYDLMKRGLGLSNAELASVYRRWNEGPLASFLVEITARIFTRQDDRSEADLIDRILDAARQKGTGMWTSQDSLELQVPAPVIDMAVMMRDLSAQTDERAGASKLFQGPSATIDARADEIISQLENALLSAFLITYAQGMALLQRASEKHNYGLKLEEVAKIWRGGCIIRAALLEDIRAAYRDRSDLPNLLLAPPIAQKVGAHQAALRETVQTMAARGIPAAGLMAALAYLDGYRSGRLPTNLIQAQRDFFGSHTYERIDVEGSFHTEWTRG